MVARSGERSAKEQDLESQKIEPLCVMVPGWNTRMTEATRSGVTYRRMYYVQGISEAIRRYPVVWQYYSIYICFLTTLAM